MGVSKYRRLECGLVKRGEEKRRKNDGEAGEDEFIHQVSLRVQSVLHYGSWNQSLHLSQVTHSVCFWALSAEPPSLPGPVSPGYVCWSPPETCTSAPEVRWWDLPHTARATEQWRTKVRQQEEISGWDEKKKKKAWEWVPERWEELICQSVKSSLSKTELQMVISDARWKKALKAVNAPSI